MAHILSPAGHRMHVTVDPETHGILLAFESLLPRGTEWNRSAITREALRAFVREHRVVGGQVVFVGPAAQDEREHLDGLWSMCLPGWARQTVRR